MTPRYSINLADLAPALKLDPASLPDIQGLTLNSRQVQPGDAFVALKGAVHDGRDYIKDAVANGAVAVLVDVDAPADVQSVPVVALPNLAGQLSELANRLYQSPSEAVKVFGVTGTNGKTTCSLLMAQLAAVHWGAAGVIGTLGYGLLKADEPSADQFAGLEHTGLTTPDALSVQKTLCSLVDQGAQVVAMEVSSHSLVQGRVAAVKMAAALFTNLSHDHLDFHGDLIRYGAAKARLLEQPGLQVAVINRDDAWAASLANQVPEGVQVVSYALDDPQADVYVTDRVEQRAGISALINTPWGQGELHSPLLGEFNLSNLLGVIATLCAAGMALEDILAAVPGLVPAPGRMEPVVLDEQRQDVQVVVDYAHTPDALENTLKALSHHNTGRLWCVFGCGGDRDRAKRPKMGRLAERYSDYVVVTNDNPRSEDPAQIAADILRGMDNDHQCLVIADRAQAIDLAIQQARPGDTVLVAGKGHEDYQIFARETLAFSDCEQVRQSLQRRLAKLRPGEVTP
ncbi:UDP-N-acetylmuramoylalanyl-D-glutamate--2,6-diaminopimelate ligase [Marinimicrobium koreense]|uniref:UDP-N-acetylmuramoyl-L-alanyl-D-glutamate--2,6-diaminopimelate ligase n=1 Tax=Marinimicrobium koreense TaxID=306545 RepID=A0A3N1NPP9_9GAMM|nr:UDP-N-acetylmuramoyl-L-alanyl-D-glutamate--2,6-diaminopimelate ligase [Marinimicrobium koreense]ROQ20832.1 UDP-N-acetylmuramoylalanyl-D-glutamate--2,6-diaminopimelate ligase [Marinimicrobium koreense]